jgi:thioredoxin 1
LHQRLTHFHPHSTTGATWCGPCQIIGPIFDELSDEISGVVFVKVDVDENPETAAKYSVSAMPTFVFIKGGEVVDRMMGASPDRLREMIEDYM